MSIELLHATSASNAAFRVVCGELVIRNNVTSHQEAVFGYLQSGSVRVEIDDNAWILNRDDIFFVSPNVSYRMSHNADAKIDIVTLSFANPSAVSQDYVPQSVIRGLLNGNCTNFARISPEDSSHEVMRMGMETVKHSETEKKDYFQLQVYGEMYKLFYELFANRHIKLIDAESKSKKFRALIRVTHYIDEHFCENLSLDEVAQATQISRYYVSHLFKELMDTTFVGYVNELRLNRAAMLLVTSEHPIIEIAAMAGFNNLSNFNRAFKMHFGVTPSAYRKK